MAVKQPTANYGNPQKEDGYTPIANELLEAILKSDFNKRQLLVIMAIARMTYGYSRKADALSGWQIATMINVDRSHVSKTLNELHKLNVINKLKTGRESHGVLVHEIQINKKYKEWLTVAKTATVAETATVAKTATVTVAKTAHEPLPKQPTHKAIKTIKQYIPKKYKRSVSIPDDFGISERVQKWADENGHKKLSEHLENFILSCNANGYTYKDWDSAFMRAIRDNWAKVSTQQKSKQDEYL